MDPSPRFSVSEFLAVANQTLDYAFPSVSIEGEIASFTVSKGKWVFFDLKDEESTVNCFTTVYNLRQVVADGMKVLVTGTPHLTKTGRFSITLKNLQPLGAGNIKKSFDLLKQKLEKEGLFAQARKRAIPKNPSKIGVISSTTAAGYHDFLKILKERWGGIEILVANTSVQGLSAADEIIRALRFFNETETLDAIVLIRGGGSKDDLAVFNDEQLAREIARSKIPVLTGIGHEVDTSIADLVADIRASTPTNAAELLTSDRNFELARLKNSVKNLSDFLLQKPLETLKSNRSSLQKVEQKLLLEVKTSLSLLEKERKILAALNPEKVLAQGYSILSGKISPGSEISITTKDKLIKAEVKHVQNRS